VSVRKRILTEATIRDKHIQYWEGRSMTKDAKLHANDLSPEQLETLQDTSQPQAFSVPRDSDPLKISRISPLILVSCLLIAILCFPCNVRINVMQFLSLSEFSNVVYNSSLGMRFSCSDHWANERKCVLGPSPDPNRKHYCRRCLSGWARFFWRHASMVILCLI
jgi:hypothetical protein